MSSVQLMKLTTHLIFTVPPDFLPSCSVRLYALTEVFALATFFPVTSRPHSHRTAGDDARTFRRGLEQHLSRAITPQNLVWNRRALQVQLDQILFRLLDALLDGHGHFARLAHAESRMTTAVADDHQRRETQVLTALDDFGDAVDGDHVI